MCYHTDMLRYRRVGVTVKSELDQKDDAVARILDILKNSGTEVLIDEKRCQELECSRHFKTFHGEHDIDLLVVIGGDGTILRAIRELKDHTVPILSVNRGAVGFLAETNIEEAETLLPKFLEGKGSIEERSLLAVRALRGDALLYEGNVLNDAVVSQGSIARLMDLQTSVNGEHLTTFRADGLIMATPTGSTAYNLSAGGPIVHPRLSAAILTPINSYSFSQKPIVLPGDQEIEVVVLTKGGHGDDVEVSLTLDGQQFVRLQKHDRVLAHINTKTVRFLRRQQDTFYHTLRSKLKWGERVEV
jgi:NAD+ kinase